MAKKIILIAVSSLAALIALILTLAAFQPQHFHIERAAEINQPPAVVYAIMCDLNRFPEWSPWSKLDPNMKKSAEGNPCSAGQSFSWESEKVGSGKMTTEALLQDKRVDIKLEFYKPQQGVSETAWVLTETSNGASKVTWSMDGENHSLMAKAFSMLFMEKMLGASFEEGLAQLKVIAER